MIIIIIIINIIATIIMNYFHLHNHFKIYCKDNSNSGYYCYLTKKAFLIPYLRQSHFLIRLRQP